MMSSSIEDTLYLRKKHIHISPSYCKKEHIFTLELDIYPSYTSVATAFMLPSYRNSIAPMCGVLILLPPLPSHTLRPLIDVSSTTRHVHISFLDRHKVTSSKSHVQKSFADIQETQASSVCFLKTHIVSWL